MLRLGSPVSYLGLSLTSFLFRKSDEDRYTTYLNQTRRTVFLIAVFRSIKVEPWQTYCLMCRSSQVYLCVGPKLPLYKG